MRRYFPTIGLIAAIALGIVPLRADTATNAPAATSTNLPAPTLEQRVASLEAYIANTDPTTPLKDTNGNVATANTPVIGNPGPGHNAWLLTSTALVLFMTLPGLALFYGGLVRRKNVLSVLAQCFLITGLVTILWVFVGYGMIFGGTGAAAKEDVITGIVGSPTIDWLFKNVTSAPNANYAYWVSENVYAMFQLMFAIITPALIIGAIAERMKFKAILVFMTLWMLLIYFTQGHMIWGINGLMNGCWNPHAKIHAIDFAGGTVVHMSSGWSALVLCLILGKRIGYGRENLTPHSLVLTYIGTGMLWVGWYGFNSGSAVAADAVAANAFTTTTIATAIASFVWPMWEWIVKGRPSVLGYCSGAVAGLVVITPACGYVTPAGAVWIGIAAGTIPWFFCYKVKGWFGYDDALDTFGVHAVGGTVGALMTGMLARNAANANLATYLKGYVTDSCFQPLVWEQIKAIGVSLVLFVVGTIVIAYITKLLVGLRPTEEVEIAGLDINEHGEEGYHS
jgi:Amt family ammonium transporter